MMRQTANHRRKTETFVALCLAGFGCGSSASDHNDAAGTQSGDAVGPTTKMDGMTMSGMDGMTMSGMDAMAMSGMDGMSEMDMGPMVSCEGDPRVVAYQNGMTKAGQAGAASVQIVSADPAPPAKGFNTWLVQLLDSHGAPIAGSLALALDMPDHGHPSPTTPVITAGATPSAFTVSQINLFMAGVWRIQLSAYAPGADGSALLDVVTIYFCIEG